MLHCLLPSKHHQFPNPCQEFPNGHPSEYCLGQELPNFSVPMGTGMSNMTEPLAAGWKLMIIFYKANKEKSQQLVPSRFYSVN